MLAGCSQGKGVVRGVPCCGVPCCGVPPCGVPCCGVVTCSSQGKALAGGPSSSSNMLLTEGLRCMLAPLTGVPGGDTALWRRYSHNMKLLRLSHYKGGDTPNTATVYKSPIIGTIGF